MHVSHTFLVLGAAATCWITAGLCHDAPRSSTGSVEPHNPLAACRSAYGSLVARLMKDSLHSYWHAGCTDATHGHPVVASAPTAAPAPAANTAPAGRFARRNPNPAPPSPLPPPPTVATSGSQTSWIESLSRSISQMEHMRTVRNSPFAVAPNHKRFLSASADWRVHVAWLLDPGDAALYEIDHFVSISSAPSLEAAKKKADELASRTILHALSTEAGLADALTGAGAAINRLNDELHPSRSDPPKTEEILRDWRTLTFCLNRHRDLRSEADEEAWWDDIPEVRRSELESYATMLNRLSSMIHKQLASNGVIQDNSSNR